MAVIRCWCPTCEAVIAGSMVEACIAVGHKPNRVGSQTDVRIVVTDRSLDLNVEKFGYYNMVGHAQGRTDSVDHEQHTRSRIEAMRKVDMQRRREQKVSHSKKDDMRRVGAIPSALLFALKRQYGNDYTQKAKELMKRENLWWGD